MKTLSSWLIVACLTVFLSAAGHAANDPVVSITEPQRNIFAGQTTLFHVTTDLPQMTTGLAWQLSRDQRTLSQGMLHFTSGSHSAELALAIPDIKEGLTLQAQLTISTIASLDLPARTLLTENLYLFHRNAFFDQEQSLAGLKIGLYDPTNTTSDMFTATGLPFVAYPDIDGIAAFDGKLFIAGTDIDFDAVPALWNELTTLARRGIPVIIFAPKSGSFKLSTHDNLAMESLSFYNEAMIRRLDKTLDTHWAPDGKTRRSALKIISQDNDAFARVSEAPEDWAVAEISLTNSTRIFICGFDITTTADISPAPRYFLARLIDHITQPSSKESLP